MQNLKHNGKLGFGVLYGALEAHAGVVADKVQRVEKARKTLANAHKFFYNEVK